MGVLAMAKADPVVEKAGQVVVADPEAEKADLEVADPVAEAIQVAEVPPVAEAEEVAAVEVGGDEDRFRQFV